MLIVCPTCATTYQVAPAALGAGRNVRCASCKNAWFATAEAVLEETAVSSTGAAESAAPNDFAKAPGEDVLPPAPPAPDNPFAVADAPPLVPQDPPDDTAPKFDPGVPDQPEAVAAKRARPTHADRKDRPGLLRRLFSLPVLIVMMLAILLGTLNWRAPVVRLFPQTASLYAAIGLPVNLRGLFFEGVKSRNEIEDGTSVLVIEGTIVNLTTRTLEVPRLRFALRNASGHEVYAWTAQPAKPTIGSGNGLPFRARLASPPGDGRDVIVRFLTRRDVAAGS
ncbi:MAG: zinc-ribbon domain-containing protein [Alphaproteobacteria bacterium]